VKMRKGNTTVYVPGSRRMLDEKNLPKFDEAGRPLWIKPKPIAHVLHFKSAAGKLRARATFNAKNAEGTAVMAVENLIVYADPKDVVRVPLYRGFDARLANQLRADIRRNQRRAA
jgi:hypothetical protein